MLPVAARNNVLCINKKKMALLITGTFLLTIEHSSNKRETIHSSLVSLHLVSNMATQTVLRCCFTHFLKEVSLQNPITLVQGYICIYKKERLTFLHVTKCKR